MTTGLFRGNESINSAAPPPGARNWITPTRRVTLLSEAGQKPNIKGSFITLEGVDGCGKSTQARLLAERLRGAGLEVLETREPGGTEIGQSLRKVLLSPASAEMTPACELLLFLADRVQHLEQVVRPALARGQVVICDRFHDATEAYQRHGRGLDFMPYQPLIDAEVMRTPPHLTLWLDLDVALAAQRMAERQAEGGNLEADNRFDEAERAFHQRVRDGYAHLHRHDPARIQRVDAAIGVEALAEAVYRIVSGRFNIS